ncbi:unnamed protein product [Heligmosomoides polygyrus]|uniref:Protein PXR1-like n=1 Tax=Heligmosomoides polygyrus TaxID=6339 RepID=A0A183G6C9_HELPZ|nr:unnamed protein product [Heligmosomoides polygyrus]
MVDTNKTEKKEASKKDESKDDKDKKEGDEKSKAQDKKDEKKDDEDEEDKEREERRKRRQNKLDKLKKERECMVKEALEKDDEAYLSQVGNLAEIRLVEPPTISWNPLRRLRVPRADNACRSTREVFTAEDA